MGGQVAGVSAMDERSDWLNELTIERSNQWKNCVKGEK
jgi:hypothetical protein